MTAVLDSVNVGSAAVDTGDVTQLTGINKAPTSGFVPVRAPGARGTGLGSGIPGDFIGSNEFHGGDRQALYAFQREDLDFWQRTLGRTLTNGYFGENLTTLGLEVNEALVGEIWRIGEDLEVRVTDPRLPCATFRAWVGEPGWLKSFTREARPGAYLAVVSPGLIQAGDAITVTFRPDHSITVSTLFKALTTHRELLPTLLEASEFLGDEVREKAIAKPQSTPGSSTVQQESPPSPAAATNTAMGVATR